MELLFQFSDKIEFVKIVLSKYNKKIEYSEKKIRKEKNSMLDINQKGRKRKNIELIVLLEKNHLRRELNKGINY